MLSCLAVNLFTDEEQPTLLALILFAGIRLLLCRSRQSLGPETKYANTVCTFWLLPCNALHI